LGCFIVARARLDTTPAIKRYARYMGIHVHLAVIADRVSEVTWREIYEKARRVAKQWKPRPLSIAWRQIGAVKVAHYSLDLDAPDGLHIVGDAETLTTGESFVFPATLDRAVSWSDLGSSPATSDDDVLVAVALRNAPEAERLVRWRQLFGNKTQGLPYHGLIVALGLLVENALPGTAVVYGDLSSSDGEAAQRGLASILGEKLEPPVVVDAERMRRRLAGQLDTDTLAQAIGEVCPAASPVDAILGDLLGLLRRSPNARVRHELEHVVCTCRDPQRLEAGTRLLLHELIEAIRLTVVRMELREQAEQWGMARTREALARGTLRSGMRLTSMAWDAIETADLDELAFLLGATCVNTTGLEVHQAVRAVLENRALRRL
jgi:hypothetical protein